jgi:hypothetical protein
MDRMEELAKIFASFRQVSAKHTNNVASSLMLLAAMGYAKNIHVSSCPPGGVRHEL